MIEKGVYWITEEVPGVPEEERFYVTGPDIKYPWPQFSTKVAAESWLRERGIADFKFERFDL